MVCVYFDGIDFRKKSLDFGGSVSFKILLFIILKLSTYIQSSLTISTPPSLLQYVLSVHLLLISFLNQNSALFFIKTKN